MSNITKRDWLLFEALGKYGLLTTTQLSDLIFQNIDHSTVMRRIRILEKAKWIYRIRALESGELVWLLRRKGEKEIALNDFMIRPNRNGIAHDVLLTDLRLTLEKVGLAENFIPEWIIKRKTFNPSNRKGSEQLIPDGVFSNSIWDGRVLTFAIELELNEKRTSRYERICSKYQEHDQLNCVWYFVKSKSFGMRLQETWKENFRWQMYKKVELIFTVISDLEMNPYAAPIYFLSGKSNSIKSLFRLAKPNELSNTPAQSVGSESEVKTETQELKSAS